MNRDEVIGMLQDVLQSIQQNSGRLAPPIQQGTCPIGDLSGFDSLNGVEATVELTDRLGVEFSGVSLFVNEMGTKALTISEIADRICKMPTNKEVQP
ncbi:MAG: hypothetical protein SGI77_10470 [Pirellulaceae bacterium]|nr:hypothetical protein [Pirellulaceae bacterium]